MNKIQTLAVTLFVSFVLPGMSQPARPRIIGLSHVGFYVHDIAKSRAFYKDFLGFAEPYSVTNKDGALKLTFIKINDHQAIELFPEKEPGSDRLYHIAFETDDAEAMRVYLQSKGVVVPDKTSKGRIGNLNYFVQDPDGHTVEMVQYAPGSWTLREQGNFLPDTRISEKMTHVGIIITNLNAALGFYQGIIGGAEFWRGSSNTNHLNWVNVRLPQNEDYVEFMLYSKCPPPDQRGKQHHFCLAVADVAKAKAILETRAGKIGYTRPLEIQTGVNRKRQLNIWDPDGTRVELMEPQTIDGIPALSSTAPPP